MSRRLLTVAALAVAVVVLTPSTAAAGFWGPFDKPRMVAKWLYPREPLRIQLQAPAHAWGIRRVAANVDRRVAGVRIYRHGSCKSRPGARCLVVRPGRWDTRWWGIMHVRSHDRRVILLNRRYGTSQNTACHELLHALGLSHHRSAGCLHGNRAVYPSRLEVRVLRRHY